MIRWQEDFKCLLDELSKTQLRPTVISTQKRDINSALLECLGKLRRVLCRDDDTDIRQLIAEQNAARAGST
jgi:hypothetical protein